TVTLLLQSSDAFLFNLTTTTEIYTLSLHDALPISGPGESGSATTAVAPSSIGADAHTDHESVAGVGHERGLSLEEKTVQRTGATEWRGLVGPQPSGYQVCAEIPAISRESQERAQRRRHQLDPLAVNRGRKTPD